MTKIDGPKITAMAAAADATVIVVPVKKTAKILNLYSSLSPKEKKLHMKTFLLPTQPGFSVHAAKTQC